MKRKKKYRPRVHVKPEYVKTGQYYWCVVTKQLVIVRIDCPISFQHDKWYARNLKTDRIIKVTANRLRYRAEHDELLIHKRLWQRERAVKQRAYRPRIEHTEAERRVIREQRLEATKRKDAKDAERIESFHVRLDRLLAADKRRRQNENPLD